MTNRFHLLADTTSLHGYPDLYNSLNWLGKLFWTTILILAVGGAFYEIGEVIKNYQNSPIVTVYEVKPAISMQYPAIILCRGNIINGSKVADLGIHPVIFPVAFAPLVEMSKSNVKALIDQTVPINHMDPTAYSGPYNVDVFGHLIVTSQSQNETVLKLKAEFSRLSIPLNDMQILQFYVQKKKALDIQYARFLMGQGREANSSTYGTLETGADVEQLLLDLQMDIDKVFPFCQFFLAPFDCSQFITPVFDVQYGICHEIRYLQPQSNPGVGMQIFIDLNLEWAYKLMPPVSNGIHLNIIQNHDPAVSTRMAAPPGSQTKISIQSINYNLKNFGKKKNCMDTDTERNITHYPYTDAACRAECFYMHQLQQCGCHGLVAKKYRTDDAKLCIKPEQLMCLNSLFTYRSIVTDSSVVQCTEQCKPPCEYWEYPHTLSYTRFPSTLMTNAYKQYGDRVAGDVERWKNNVIVLDIAYDELQYTRIYQEVSMRIDELGSQVGGYLGLFIGASLISLTQAVVIFVCGDCGGKTEQHNDSANQQFKNNTKESEAPPDPKPTGQIFDNNKNNMERKAQSMKVHPPWPLDPTEDAFAEYDEVYQHLQRYRADSQQKPKETYWNTKTFPQISKEEIYSSAPWEEV